MKQFLLLAMIHVLIFHQYKKDKTEVLAPKKSNKPVKTTVLQAQAHLFSGIKNTTKDSLFFFPHTTSQGPYYLNYFSWPE